MVDLSKETLVLNYPCSWIYKIVVLENDNAKQITKDIFGQREYKIKASKTSKKGKFKSYQIDILVHNEEDRKTLYELLGNNKQIKMVI